MRLHDALMSDCDLPAAANEQPAAGHAAGGSSGYMRVGTAVGAPGSHQPPPPRAEDGWVTAFGFQPDDLPSVLRMFQECGDILQWSGGGGGGGGGNFAHLQFATREGAQRALLRSGSMLRPGLIVGVKSVDARQRAMLEGGGGGAGAVRATPPTRQAATPQRAYRVVAAGLGGGGGDGAAAALPQPTRSWAQKFSEFVLGA